MIHFTDKLITRGLLHSNSESIYIFDECLSKTSGFTMIDTPSGNHTIDAMYIGKCRPSIGTQSIRGMANAYPITMYSEFSLNGSFLDNIDEATLFNEVMSEDLQRLLDCMVLGKNIIFPSRGLGDNRNGLYTKYASQLVEELIELGIPVKTKQSTIYPSISYIVPTDEPSL